jgi:hypothetical protein
MPDLELRNIDDLERLVRERIEETSRLEFKSRLPDSAKNEDLARDVAAMCNSGGGTIVYGVQEEEGRACGLIPIALAGVPERIALVAHTSIDEPLAVADIRTIESGGGEGFIVLTISPSPRSPHFIKGQALGRSARTNVTLTRRQIGELFARSPGFATEFGLTAGRPGRVKVTTGREPQVASGTSAPWRYHIRFENDGDAAVSAVEWKWTGMEPAQAPAIQGTDPFPVEEMQPRSELTVSVLLRTGGIPTNNTRIIVGWTDVRGERHEESWPVSF